MYIQKLYLRTSDLTAQHQFYSERLGLSTQRIDNTLHIQAGRTTIIFTQQTDFTAIYHFALNIPENQVSAARRWLQTRVPLISQTGRLVGIHDATEIIHDFPSWNAHAIYFKDAAGNIAEFIGRHGLPNARYTPFDGQSVECVSEIGIATDDVQATVQQLRTHYDLPIYDGHDSDTFTALGDEHGLFIIVKAGRMWYPKTGMNAEVCPLSIELQHGEHHGHVTF
jgi:catechol-2,3-dioxygenase